MIKKLMEEGPQFHIKQKESYTFDDVQGIIDQHTRSIIKNNESTINDRISLLSKEAETFKAKVEESAGSATELTKKIAELETKLKDTNAKYAPYQEAEKTKSANDLLGGLVVKGAEADAYLTLEDQIKEIDFKDAKTVEDKKKLIKPLVSKLLETKAYLKPVEDNGSEDPEFFEEDPSKSNDNDLLYISPRPF